MHGRQFFSLLISKNNINDDFQQLVFSTLSATSNSPSVTHSYMHKTNLPGGHWDCALTKVITNADRTLHNGKNSRFANADCSYYYKIDRIVTALTQARRLVGQAIQASMLVHTQEIYINQYCSASVYSFIISKILITRVPTTLYIATAYSYSHLNSKHDVHFRSHTGSVWLTRLNPCCHEC